MKMSININKEVNPHFENFIFDWDYQTYLLLGGYGSSKSYHIAFKIITKCLQEKRKVLVIREVYETIRESCYDLFCEILEDMELLSDGVSRKYSKTKVIGKTSPMMLSFPNGSKIIFKGMDKPAKLKSINGVSIVWLEECSEVKYSGYKELIGRIRHPFLSLHFILSTNPVDEQNWVFSHFFIDEENDRRVLDPERLYKKKIIIKNGVYYHHSLPDDNYFLPVSYIRNLDELQDYDKDLYRVARLGRFGSNGLKVLPQFETAPHLDVMREVQKVPDKHKFNGMDFGFETSYNAIVRMAVDDVNKVLYIYAQYYKNKMTDDRTAVELQKLGWDDIKIIADSEDPKAIAFYQQSGFRMRGAHKQKRVSQVRKIKRFKKIICSEECKDVIRELKTLTYAKDPQGRMIYDEFNIDPHTFSAIWYGLDLYEVADLKERKRNNMKGSA